MTPLDAYIECLEILRQLSVSDAKVVVKALLHLEQWDELDRMMVSDTRREHGKKLSVAGEVRKP